MRDAISDFVLPGDPQTRGACILRGEVTPMVKHGGLHPCQVGGIVNMAHFVNMLRGNVEFVFVSIRRIGSTYRSVETNDAG